MSNAYLRNTFGLHSGYIYRTAIDISTFQYCTETSTFQITTIHCLLCTVSFGSSSTGTIRQERSKRNNPLCFASLQNVLFKDDQIEYPLGLSEHHFNCNVVIKHNDRIG